MKLVMATLVGPVFSSEGTELRLDEDDDEATEERDDDGDSDMKAAPALTMESLLAILPPLQRCAKHEGWYVSTIDAHRAEIERLLSHLPSSARPHNAKSHYKHGYHRSVLRCAIRHAGGSLKSKRATRNKHATQFWILVRDPTSQPAIVPSSLPRQVVERCLLELQSLMGEPMWRRVLFVVPSAGNGAFFKALSRGRRIAVEQDAKLAAYLKSVAGGDLVVCGDFCRVTSVELGLSSSPSGNFEDEDEKNTSSWDVPRSIVCVIGDPPFGEEGSKAQAFLAHACSLADTVALVLPAEFSRNNSSQARAVDHRLHLERAVPLEIPGQERLCAFCVYRRRYSAPQDMQRKGNLTSTSSASSRRKRKAASDPDD